MQIESARCRREEKNVYYLLQMTSKLLASTGGFYFVLVIFVNNISLLSIFDVICVMHFVYVVSAFRNDRKMRKNPFVSFLDR